MKLKDLREAVSAIKRQETKFDRELLDQILSLDIADTFKADRDLIKTHARHIFEKLEVSDRTRAALWATRLDLLPSDQPEVRSADTSISRRPRK